MYKYIPRRVLIKKIKYFTIITFVTYVGIELICYLFILSGYIPAQLPSFNFVKTIKEYPLQIADIDSIWGTWHYKGNHRYKKSCFDISYSINSYGARDIERNKKSSLNERVVVLGDSFLEGFGVNVEKRITNILENKLNKEFLNFACSDFGLTQEYLVYKHLAKDFDHSTLLIGFLPFNDFKDDNPVYEDQGSRKRYKPYFIKADTGYKLTYKEKKLFYSTFTKESFLITENTFQKKTIRFAKAFTFWGNIISYFKYKELADRQRNKYSYYFEYSEDEIKRFYFIVDMIKQEAVNKRVILVCIPTNDDIGVYKRKGFSKLSKHLISFCYERNIDLIDMLPFLSSQKANLYLTCDGHWSETGNAIIADYLVQKLTILLNSPK